MFWHPPLALCYYVTRITTDIIFGALQNNLRRPTAILPKRICQIEYWLFELSCKMCYITLQISDAVKFSFSGNEIFFIKKEKKHVFQCILMKMHCPTIYIFRITEILFILIHFFAIKKILRLTVHFTKKHKFCCLSFSILKKYLFWIKISSLNKFHVFLYISRKKALSCYLYFSSYWIFIYFVTFGSFGISKITNASVINADVIILCHHPITS